MLRSGLRCLLLALVALATGQCGISADVTIAIEPRWRGQAIVVPAEGLKNDSGQTLELTRVAALLSGAALVRKDGAVVRLEGQFGFIDAATRRLSWTLRNVPAGDYVGLEFLLGVPATLNHGDPGKWAPRHALNPLVNGLHWSWQSGYVFAALEGHWREAGEDARRGPRFGGFSYHLATDDRLMAVGFRSDFSIQGAITVALAWDLARVLGKLEIDPRAGAHSTHSGEGDTLAPRLAESVQRAWFWLEARAGAAPPEPVVETHPQTASRAASRGTPFAFTVPAGFPQPELPADNPLTREGVALGERLFFDRRLSSNGTQSCASCHVPERAFSDEVALSRGATGARGKRNAMPLFNLAWSSNFAWDGGQARVRDQARAAWTNPVEMNADPDQVLKALAQDMTLRADYARVFGTEEITAERTVLALEQFLLTRVAADSRFDRALRGEGQLTEEEQRGFTLFATEYDPARGRRGADCFHCHGGPLFSDFVARNTGLATSSSDLGREAITGSAADRGKFKTPSLRNVALTGPYMHDGRFATLEDVVAHYDHGVRRTATLDPNLAKHPPQGMRLAPAEQRALVAFLRALTEEKSYSSPSQ